MFILQFINNPLLLLSFLIAIAMALTLHEFAHAYVALRLGDSTAKLSGRVSLNPLAHIDLTGAIALLLIGFGWGKPVPINPNLLKKPAIDQLKIALAGPLANLIQAVVFGLILRFASASLSVPLIALLNIIVMINLYLMFFNLIPLPPLDGSKVIAIFSWQAYEKLQRVGTSILLILVFLSYTNLKILSFLIVIPSNWLSRLIIGG